MKFQKLSNLFLTHPFLENQLNTCFGSNKEKSRKDLKMQSVVISNLCVSYSVVSDSLAPWTVAGQATLFMGIPRQEHWSGLLFPPPGYLPHPGIESISSALAGGFFTTEPPGKPIAPGQQLTFMITTLRNEKVIQLYSEYTG